MSAGRRSNLFSGVPSQQDAPCPYSAWRGEDRLLLHTCSWAALFPPLPLGCIIRKIHMFNALFSLVYLCLTHLCQNLWRFEKFADSFPHNIAFKFENSQESPGSVSCPLVLWHTGSSTACIKLYQFNPATTWTDYYVILSMGHFCNMVGASCLCMRDS